MFTHGWWGWGYALSLLKIAAESQSKLYPSILKEKNVFRYGTEVKKKKYETVTATISLILSVFGKGYPGVRQQRVIHSDCV